MRTTRALTLLGGAPAALVLTGCATQAGAADAQEELRTTGRVATVSLTQGGVAEYYTADYRPDAQDLDAIGPLETREAQQLNEALTTIAKSGGALCLTRSGVPSPSVMGDYLISHWDTWKDATVHGQPIHCEARDQAPRSTP